MSGKGSRLGMTPDEYRQYRNAKKKKRYHENPKRVYRWNRTSLLQAKFGMTIEDYEQMFEDQKGCCAICGEEEDGRALAVDHCHRTGSVRGLLCGSCNRALGLLKDDPDIIEKAREYVSSGIVS